MVTCAVFLRLNSLLKLAVLLLAVAVYAYLIHLAFLALTRADMLHRSVRPLEQSCVHWTPLSDKCANILPGVARTTNHNVFKTNMMHSAHFNCIYRLSSHPSIPSFSMLIIPQISVHQKKRNFHPSHFHVYCCRLLQRAAGVFDWLPRSTCLVPLSR